MLRSALLRWQSLPEFSQVADARLLSCLQSTLEDSLQQIEQRREDDFLGNMLWMQNVRSTEYFSRWIELKETQKQQATQITSP